MWIHYKGLTLGASANTILKNAKTPPDVYRIKTEYIYSKHTEIETCKNKNRVHKYVQI